MKKKETINQQEWKKEEARAKRLIKKYEQQGFVFDFEIPKKPKVITKKSLEEFKRQTRATKILSKGVRVVDQVTGETETARKAVEKKRSAALKAAWKRRKWIEIGPGGGDDGGDGGDGGGGIGGDPPGVADVILKNFYDLCDYWAESPKNWGIRDNVSMLRSAVDRFIEKYGKEAVAQAIEESALTVYFGIIILYEREVRNILDQINDIADEIVSNLKEEEKKKNGKKTDEK